MIDYLLLAKAAMLHDIGKLCYRAGMTDDSEVYAQFGAQWLARLLPQDDERAQQLLRCVSYHRRCDLKTAGLAPDDWALRLMTWRILFIWRTPLLLARKKRNALPMRNLTQGCAWNRCSIIFRTRKRTSVIFCRRK